MLPLLSKGEPSFDHRYVSGSEPSTSTLKIACCPAFRVRLAGGVTTEGGTAGRSTRIFNATIPFCVSRPTIWVALASTCPALFELPLFVPEAMGTKLKFETTSGEEGFEMS